MMRAGPVGGTLTAVLFLLIFHLLRSYDAPQFLIWLYGCMVALCGYSVARDLWSAFQWGCLLRNMHQSAGTFGRTGFPTAADAERIGLSFTNEDGNGIPLGGTGNKIIYYHGPSHISVRAATNAGKTESLSATICYALGAHRNVVATAKGAELAWLCARYREDELGQQAYIVDPFGIAKRLGLKTHDFNPVGHLPRYAAARSPELLDRARAVTLILTPESDAASGENKIFRQLARDLKSGVLSFLAVEQADTGELCCNLPTLQRVLRGSNESLMEFLHRMRRCNAYDGAISRAADSFLGRLERSPKFAESILAQAIAPLDIYEPAGPLGRNTLYSDFDVRELKQPGRGVSIFFVTAPEKSELYHTHIGLCLNATIEESIAADRFEPRLTIVGDEWASLGVLPAALPTLFLGRSRGVQLVTFVQQTESYERYGKQAAAFTTQSEVVIAWAIRSTKDAKEYSERAGQLSAITESISAVPQTTGSRGPSITLAERGIPYLRPDEFLQLPDYTGVVFYKQNPPFTVDLVSFRSVDGWREHGQPMPGAPPLRELPVKYKA